MSLLAPLCSLALFVTTAAGAAYTDIVVARNPSDLILAGGASVNAAPLNSLRSGNPGQHSTASFVTPLTPGATLQSIEFQYQYDTGFNGNTSAGIGSNFTLSLGGFALYASQHLNDYSYGANRTNYSAPIPVRATGFSVTVPVDGHLEFSFDCNDKNMQLLLPLHVSLTCVGAPCVKTQRPQTHTLSFSPPNIVSGPDGPTIGGGPFWDQILRVSDTHAMGWANSHYIASNDSGTSWSTLIFNDSCTTCGGSLSSKFAYDGGPGFHNLGNLRQSQGTARNITGLHANASTRYFVGSDGSFKEEPTAAVSVTGLPNLRMYGGSGDCLTLPDKSILCVGKATLGDGNGMLSCIAIRSLDGGFNWTFASVVARQEEVPYAHEGPSESTLAVLANGTLMAVMRVEGQSGRYSPYISKLSDDSGLTWHSLRSLNSGGEGLGGAGSVRPRLMPVGNSLVMGGGRPNSLSRDVLVWLNSAGDGEEWQAFSISYQHNQRTNNSAWLWPEEATNNSRSFPRVTPSYTSMVSTGNSTGYILYGMGIRSFTMSFQLTKRNGQ